MLCELKTSLLSPKNYFELFMIIFDELGVLEAHFIEE
jgi:vacuolar protein sorting-associated protein 35